MIFAVSGELPGQSEVGVGRQSSRDLPPLENHQRESRKGSGVCKSRPENGPPAALKTIVFNVIG